MIKKAFAAALLLSTVAICSSGQHYGARAAGSRTAHVSAAAHAIKTYTDAKLGYSFQYPSTWVLQSGIKAGTYFGKYGKQMADTAVLFASPDQVALGGILVHSSATSTTQIKALSKSFLYDGIKAVGTLNVSVKTINGLTFQFSELVAKSTTGSKSQADEFVAGASHGTHTYYLVGAVVITKTAKATLNARIQDIANVVSSLVLK